MTLRSHLQARLEYRIKKRSIQRNTFKREDEKRGFKHYRMRDVTRSENPSCRQKLKTKKHIESHWIRICQRHKWDIHQENSMVIKKDKSSRERLRKQPWCRHVNNLRDCDYVRNMSGTFWDCSGDDSIVCRDNYIQNECKTCNCRARPSLDQRDGAERAGEEAREDGVLIKCDGAILVCIDFVPKHYQSLWSAAWLAPASRQVVSDTAICFSCQRPGAADTGTKQGERN